MELVGLTLQLKAINMKKKILKLNLASVKICRFTKAGKYASLSVHMPVTNLIAVLKAVKYVSLSVHMPVTNLIAV